MQTASESLRLLSELSKDGDPNFIYALILHGIFSDAGEGLNEDEVANTATGIRNTVVWKKLYPFQRDGMVSALDRLGRFPTMARAESMVEVTLLYRWWPRHGSLRVILEGGSVARPEPLILV
jgi:hypothetical protein